MKTEPEKGQKRNQPGFLLGVSIALGAGVGVTLGTSVDNIGVGIAIGAGIGVAIGAALENRQSKPRE
jgi:Glycine zipper